MRNNEIKAIEDKYGLVLFRMGLTHLVDVGVRHFDDESVASAITSIEKDAEVAKEQGHISIMTPEFQCAIIQCAAELAKFSIMELFCYIKLHFEIG